MAKKIAKKNKIMESSREDKIMVLLENMTDQIKAVAEGHSGLQRGIDDLKGRFDGLEGRFDGLEGRFDRFEKRFDRFELETNNNFKVVFEYLSRIDDQLEDIRNDLKNNYEKKGWDAKWRKSIEERVEKMEKMMKSKDFSMSMLRDK